MVGNAQSMDFHGFCTITLLRFYFKLKLNFFFINWVNFVNIFDQNSPYVQRNKLFLALARKNDDLSLKLLGFFCFTAHFPRTKHLDMLSWFLNSIFIEPKMDIIIHWKIAMCFLPCVPKLSQGKNSKLHMISNWIIAIH